LGPRALGRFAELATQAQDVGARLGIEFFPWSNIKTLTACGSSLTPGTTRAHSTCPQ
jgi:hypothetical protein